MPVAGSLPASGRARDGLRNIRWIDRVESRAHYRSATQVADLQQPSGEIAGIDRVRKLVAVRYRARQHG